MKANTHPDYHEIKVVMTDGTEYTTRSTWGKAGDTMRLDIDSLSHPAWRGGQTKILEKGQLSKFEKRFGSCCYLCRAHDGLHPDRIDGC